MTIQQLGNRDIYLKFDDSYLEGLHAVQGETGRTYTFTLLDGEGRLVDASPYTLTMAVSIKGGINQSKARGTSDGKFTVAITPDMISRYGRADVQLTISDEDRTLASLIGNLEIERNISFDDGEGVNLLLDFGEIKQKLDTLDSLVQESNKSLNETIQERDKACECATKACECASVAQDGAKRAEKVREEADDIFSSEAKRKEEEAKRQSAESVRVSGEKTRESQESTRQAEEKKRSTAEASRVEAENSRASAEKDRQSQESTRESNEDKRKSNETTRQNAESIRVQQYDKVRQLLEILGENPTADLGLKVGEIDDKVSNLFKTIPYPNFEEVGTTLQKVTIWEDETGLRYKTEDVGFIIDEAVEIPIKSTTKEISFKAISDNYITVLLTDQKEFNKYFRLAKTGRQFKVDVTGVEKIIISCINNLDAKVKIWDWEEV